MPARVIPEGAQNPADKVGVGRQRDMNARILVLTRHDVFDRAVGKPEAAWVTGRPQGSITGPDRWEIVGIGRDVCPMKTKSGRRTAKKQIVCLNSSISNKPNGMIDDMIRHARARFMSRPDDQKFSSTLDRDRLWRCNLRKELNVLPLRAWID